MWHVSWRLCHPTLGGVGARPAQPCRPSPAQPCTAKRSPGPGLPDGLHILVVIPAARVQRHLALQLLNLRGSGGQASGAGRLLTDKARRHCCAAWPAPQRAERPTRRGGALVDWEQGSLPGRSPWASASRCAGVSCPRDTAATAVAAGTAAGMSAGLRGGEGQAAVPSAGWLGSAALTCCRMTHPIPEVGVFSSQPRTGTHLCWCLAAGAEAGQTGDSCRQQAAPPPRCRHSPVCPRQAPRCRGIHPALALFCLCPLAGQAQWSWAPPSRWGLPAPAPCSQRP